MASIFWAWRNWASRSFFFLLGALASVVSGDPVDPADLALLGEFLHGGGPQLHDADAVAGRRPGQQHSRTSMQSDRGLPLAAASKKARTLITSSSWTIVEKAFPRSEALS